MNTECGTACRTTLNWFGVVGAFAAMAVLVLALRHYTTVPSVNVARAQERTRIAAEVRQKTEVELHTVAYLDKEKGVVRLPNEVATTLATRAWQEPARFRADLLDRAGKAFFVPPPPPPPPEMKSDFE